MLTQLTNLLGLNHSPKAHPSQEGATIDLDFAQVFAGLEGEKEFAEGEIAVPQEQDSPADDVEVLTEGQVEETGQSIRENNNDVSNEPKENRKGLDTEGLKTDSKPFVDLEGDAFTKDVAAQNQTKGLDHVSKQEVMAAEVFRGNSLGIDQAWSKHNPNRESGDRNPINTETDSPKTNILIGAEYINPTTATPDPALKNNNKTQVDILTPTVVNPIDQGRDTGLKQKAGSFNTNAGNLERKLPIFSQIDGASATPSSRIDTGVAKVTEPIPNNKIREKQEPLFGEIQIPNESSRFETGVRAPMRSDNQPSPAPSVVANHDPHIISETLETLPKGLDFSNLETNISSSEFRKKMAVEAGTIATSLENRIRPTSLLHNSSDTLPPIGDQGNNPKIEPSDENSHFDSEFPNQILSRGNSAFESDNINRKAPTQTTQLNDGDILPRGRERPVDARQIGAGKTENPLPGSTVSEEPIEQQLTKGSVEIYQSKLTGHESVSAINPTEPHNSFHRKPQPNLAKHENASLTEPTAARNSSGENNQPEPTEQANVSIPKSMEARNLSGETLLNKIPTADTPPLRREVFSPEDMSIRIQKVTSRIPSSETAEIKEAVSLTRQGDQETLTRPFQKPVFKTEVIQSTSEPHIEVETPANKYIDISVDDVPSSTPKTHIHSEFSQETSVKAIPSQETAQKSPLVQPTTGVNSPILAGFDEDIEGFELAAIGNGADARQVASTTHSPAPIPNVKPDSTHLVRQVSEGIQRMSEGGVELRLSPEELGSVRMQFVHTEQGLNVHISAERSETLDLIRRHIEQLAKDLEASGFDATGFTFGDETPRGDQKQFAGGRSDPEASDEVLINQPVSVIHDGLDIRV